MSFASALIALSRVVVLRSSSQGILKSRVFPRRIRQAFAFAAIMPLFALAMVISSNGSTYSPIGNRPAANLLQANATSVTLTSSLNPAYTSQSVTLVAVVSSGSSVVPTGIVTFFDGATALAQGTLDSTGQVQYTTCFTTVGTHSLTAQYSGDANDSASVGTLNQNVNAPPTPASISVTPAGPVLLAGGSQQLIATGTYADGSTLDLTVSSTWYSSNNAIVSINATGMSTAVTSGTVNTSATYNGVSSPLASFYVKKQGANLMFLGGGSSAMFMELGQTAQSSPATRTPCVWTYSGSSSADSQVLVRDNRPTHFPPSLPIDDVGKLWITWGPGTGTCANPTGNFDMYAYTELDSAVGDRCYFEVDTSDNNPGCIQYLTVSAGTPGENLLCVNSNSCVYGPDTPIPAVVTASIHGQHWFAVGTDMLPEDAKYAVYRMFTPCGQPIFRQAFDQQLRETYGLGYQGTVPGIGVPILSGFTASYFNLLDFNFTGNDPLNTTQPVPGYSVTNLGATPILIVVSPAGGTGIGAATDILGYVLASFQEGSLGRSTDLFGPTVTAPITTLINEPLSGPYNVMEYSVTNSSQFHTSQDIWNCTPSGGVYSNGMYLPSVLGNTQAYRVRALGTDEMITQLQAATPSDQRMGYIYWSAANASSFTASNGKYITLNGVDPIQNSYTDGVLPGVDTYHPLSNVTFKNLNAGDYPLWSVLRIISSYPTPYGVSVLVSAAQTLNNSQHNFVSPTNLQVWHSHYYLPAVGSNVAANGITIGTAGDLCNIPNALSEVGGDIGGANITKQGNADFCQDYGVTTGLINKTQ